MDLGKRRIGNSLPNHAKYDIPAGISAAGNTECGAIIALSGRKFGSRNFDGLSRFRSSISTVQTDDSPEIREAEIAVVEVPNSCAPPPEIANRNLASSQLHKVHALFSHKVIPDCPHRTSRRATPPYFTCKPRSIVLRRVATRLQRGARHPRGPHWSSRPPSVHTCIGHCVSLRMPRRRARKGPSPRTRHCCTETAPAPRA